MALREKSDRDLARATGISTLVDGPFANLADPTRGYEAECSRALAARCVGKWALHPQPGDDRDAGDFAREGGGSNGAQLWKSLIVTGGREAVTATSVRG